MYIYGTIHPRGIDPPGRAIAGRGYVACVAWRNIRLHETLQKADLARRRRSTTMLEQEVMAMVMETVYDSYVILGISPLLVHLSFAIFLR